MDAGAAADSVIVELPDEKAPIVSKYGVYWFYWLESTCTCMPRKIGHANSLYSLL